MVVSLHDRFLLELVYESFMTKACGECSVKGKRHGREENSPFSCLSRRTDSGELGQLSFTGKRDNGLSRIA